MTALFVDFLKILLVEKVKSPSSIGSGISQKCNLKARLNNITKSIVQLDPMDTEEVVFSLLKGKIKGELGKKLSAYP